MPWLVAINSCLSNGPICTSRAPFHGPTTPATVNDVTGGGKAYVYKSALEHCVDTPKQKQLMHSSSRFALSLKKPVWQTLPFPFTLRIVSGVTKCVPIELMISHEYAPESRTSTPSQVSTPYPLLLVEWHFSGTWPQFKRQTINGTGTPTARHEILNVSPGWRLTSGGGGWATTGALQPISSEPSKQSECESHSNDFGMHWPFRHWYSLDRQVDPGTEVSQFSSSELSSQSLSPSINNYSQSNSQSVSEYVSRGQLTATPCLQNTFPVIATEFVGFATAQIAAARLVGTISTIVNAIAHLLFGNAIAVHASRLIHRTSCWRPICCIVVCMSMKENNIVIIPFGWWTFENCQQMKDELIFGYNK